MTHTEIVVGVNRSAAALGSVEWAARRAARTGARLRVVHVIDEAIRATDNAELLLAAQSHGQRILDEALDVVRRVAPDVAVEASLEQGDTVHVFGDLAESAALLVIGSDAEGSDGRRTTEHESPKRSRGVRGIRLAAASAVPVAVIPSVDVSDRNRIVVGVDESELGGRALAFAVEEARALGATLVAVHALPVPPVSDFGLGNQSPALIVDPIDYEHIGRAALERALDGIDLDGLSVDHVVVVDEPAFAIADAARDASLVVVGSHGRTGIARLLLGSVSHGVLAHLEAPTVVVR
ncbi:universal stress protein [Agromyces atrinae]|nr:universal stress protein [Agromyces atrinae]NYD68539.1 nucleotide-binding universal stress UspA family protein [Agromyces atrinae]